MNIYKPNIKANTKIDLLTISMDDTDVYMEQNLMSSPDASITDTSYYETSSEDGGNLWFGLNGSLSGFAKSVGRNIDDLAHTINRGARNIINELSELENEAMGLRSDNGSLDGSSSNLCEPSPDSSVEITILPLPWEICLQSTESDMKISIVQKEDEILKESILALSTNEEVFTKPFTDSTKASESFRLDDARVMLIRRLLEVDRNLGKIHAKVSGRSEVKETLFWQNYFFHCERVKEERQEKINEEYRRRASHDDELDAELVGRPPASCTGFYPRTGKLHDYSSSDSVNKVDEGHLIPAINRAQSNDDDFVIIEDYDVV